MIDVYSECLRQEKEACEKFAAEAHDVAVSWINTRHVCADDIRRAAVKVKNATKSIPKTRTRYYAEVRAYDGEIHYWWTEDEWLEQAVFLSPRSMYMAGTVSERYVASNLEMHYGKYWAKRFMDMYAREKKRWYVKDFLSRPQYYLFQRLRRRVRWD